MGALTTDYQFKPMEDFCVSYEQIAMFYILKHRQPGETA